MINQMEADGIIARYAVGGEAATALYLPAVSARHLDIYAAFPAEAGKLIFNPAPVFNYLVARGATIQGAHIVVEDAPTLFVPPSTPLLKEALHEATERDLEGTPVRVFTADHLAALAFQSGRANARLLEFAAADVLDVDRFQAIITRHGLLDRWREFLKNQR